MPSRISTLRHLKSATMVELGLYLRGVAAILSVVLILTVIQLSVRPKTASELAWRVPAIVLYLANVVALQMQAFDPSLCLAYTLVGTLLLLCALNIANFVVSIVNEAPLWYVLYIVSAVVQLLTIRVVWQTRQLLLSDMGSKDGEDVTNSGAGIVIEEESKTPVY